MGNYIYGLVIIKGAKSGSGVLIIQKQNEALYLRMYILQVSNSRS